MTMQKQVNVLGEVYRIEVHKTSEDEELKNNHWSGYCDYFQKLIVIGDLSEEEYYKKLSDREKVFTEKLILRHEINHAFLNESGLRQDTLQSVSGWADNEEMVDWFALQAPKIIKAYKEAEAL